MAAQENNLWVLVGNVEDVRAALQAGGDPNTRGGTDNKTCLMWAVIRGNEEMVDVLLEQPSIEVNAKDPINRLLEGQCCHVEQAAGGPRSLAQREDGKGQDSDHGGDKVWKA